MATIASTKGFTRNAAARSPRDPNPWVVESRAMVKLGARDRAQMVVLAYESGLARPGWL